MSVCVRAQSGLASPHFQEKINNSFIICFAITISLAPSYYAAVNHMLQDKQENTVHKVNFSPGPYSTVFILFLLRKRPPFVLYIRFLFLL